uniref:Uncharacterized protein n=1 Tax=Aegilops tauschii subsp. strangulata TaxID=200361 RepID=A0A453LVD2_AEGTS
MEEWVLRPPDSNNSTALDDILPCADAAATSEALRRSKEVNHQLVATLNDVLANVSNANAFPPGSGPPLNYNQSGPPVPLLCSPYRADLSDRPCAAGEVPAAFAPQAWRGHVCQVAGAPGPETCATPGRLTPSMYAQALAVANASAGLVGYGPVLADCGAAEPAHKEDARRTARSRRSARRRDPWLFCKKKTCVHAYSS